MNSFGINPVDGNNGHKGEHKLHAKRQGSNTEQGTVAAGGTGSDQRCEQTRAGSESVRAIDRHRSEDTLEPDYTGRITILHRVVGSWLCYRQRSVRRHVERG